MSKAILKIDMPKSCNKCGLKDLYIPKLWEGCIYQRNPLSMGIVKARKQRHAECPLQDTTELLEALEEIMDEDSDDRRLHCANDYNKLHKALGGIK